jgi:formate hydrogenlyase subunit 4
MLDYIAKSLLIFKTVCLFCTLFLDYWGENMFFLLKLSQICHLFLIILKIYFILQILFFYLDIK